MDFNLLLVGLVSGLMLILGALGSVLPVLPGPPLSFAGLWLYAWYTGYEQISYTALIIFAVLTTMTFLVDLMAPAIGARGYKASQYGVAGSVLGAFAGIFVLGPIGLLVGPFIGAFVGEMIYAKNLENATRVAWGAFLGFVIGSVFKIAVTVGMLAYFIYVLIF